MSDKITKQYSQVAEIYSHLMRLIDYSQWAYYYYIISKEYISSNAKVLELAAGNCKLAEAFSIYYSNIIVSDISLKMLLKSNSKIKNKICCDMRKLPVRSKFDLIFSAFDSVNYLLNIDDLNSLFSEVYQILSDNGIFTFDLSLEYNSMKNSKLLNRKGIYNKIKYKQESYYDIENSLHYNNFTIKFPDGNFVYEKHIQKIYSIEEVIFALVENNFHVINCFEAFSLEDVNDTSERVQIIAKKIN